MLAKSDKAKSDNFNKADVEGSKLKCKSLAFRQAIIAQEQGAASAAGDQRAGGGDKGSGLGGSRDP